MRTLSFTLLAVFSCVAMIGATAVGSRPHAEVMKRDRKLYVSQQQTARDDSDQTEKSFSSPDCMECPEDPICVKCTDTPEVFPEECTGFCADNPNLPICGICPDTPHRDICKPRSE